MAQGSTAFAQGEDVKKVSTGTLVKTISWEGDNQLDSNEIFKGAGDGLIGKRIDDAQLGNIQEGLTQQLRKQGYLVGRVVVSPQGRALFDRTGNLNLMIFPGKVGKISIKNSSATDGDWIKDVAVNTLCPDGVGENCILTSAKFERMTQLMQDTAGLQIGALEFSAEGMPIGQTQLTITTVANGSQITGAVGIDNQGFNSTGQYRLGASAKINNLFGVGDVLAFNAFTSNKGAISGELNVSGPLSSNGLRWQSSISRSEFFVPDVNSSGFGNAVSVGVAYPIVRGLDANWTTALNAVGVSTISETTGALTTNKFLSSGQLVLDGNSGDRSITLGQSSWHTHLALTMGRVSDSAAISGSNQPLGDYTKLAFQGVGKLVISDVQNIFATINVRGQVANTNLDPYEKQTIGGFSGVRAYSLNQGSFNQGTITTAELRKVFNTQWGQFAPAVFVDYANGWINHATYPSWQLNNGYSNSNLSNHMVLSDAGLGLDWSGFYGLSASASWARRLPLSPAGLYSVGNANSQFWFLVQSRF